MVIRPVMAADEAEWLRMHKALRPTPSDEMLAAGMIEQLNAQQRAVFVIDRGNGKLGGFVDVSIRPGREGNTSVRTAYVESLYVDPDLRRQGFGRELLAAAERWAVTKGMTEIASETENDDRRTIAIHKALGFREGWRRVYFLKSLR
jgi:aminoglycoside 6'-N-acetyltransferase I